MSAAATASERQEMLELANLVREGSLDEASRRAAAADGEGASDDMLAFAAMVATRAGADEPAVRLLERLHRRRPDERATRLNLAAALIARGDFTRAAKLVAPLNGDPAADRLGAYAAQQLGDLAAARNLYRRVLEAHPDDADSWGNLGNVLGAFREFHAAIDAFERAITLRRGDVRLYLALAQLLDNAERQHERRVVARAAVAIAPDDPAAHRALGLAEAALFETEAAEAALRRSIAIAPADPAAYLDLTVVLEGANRLEALDALAAEARQHLGPERAMVEGWAALRRGRLAEAAAAAEAMPDTIFPARRAHLRALAADQIGDNDRAFDAFAEMNRATQAAAPDPVGPSYRESVIRQTAAVRAAPAWHADDGFDDGLADPVFIMGFPRSGTTLLDTILGQLEHTTVLEEQPILSTIEQEIGGSAAALALDHAGCGALRERYRALLASIAPEAADKRIVDKHPLHMTRMPLIRSIFPDATILLVERHPCDVLLSCFSTNFRLNTAMRSFLDLEEAARTYDAVWTAWSEATQRLGGSVHPVRYERLIVDPEREVRAIVARIGATFRPDLLDTASAARKRGPARTASYAQVAEPIYRRSAGRWRRYRAQLAPVMPILAPWIRRLGYEP